ncbi:4'-phosphopantetheinyl transferase superfamily protein [Streptomyces sp. NPDC088106]|uniref:4'-phosphopantetheinyl transferase family protein n=1 Tax=Streptomyces sp. NPDC088106 TaxID=3154867 RepID=UPI00341741C2
MIDHLVPDGVELCEAYGDTGLDAELRAAACLFPSERAVVRGVSEERRREFATARGCARRALARLGIPPEPLVPDVSGAPRWPRGAVGSLTHCPGYRAAVVAPAGRYAALGIDAEPAGPLPAVVAERLLSDTERRSADALRTALGIPADRLVFCAKEASYKAFSPWLGRRYGMRDFAVCLAGDGSFRGAVPERRHRFEGRWEMRSGYLLAVVCLTTANWSEPLAAGVSASSGWQQAVM